MGRMTDGIKLFGAGVFLVFAGYYWLLPQSYQTDFLGRTYFYPVYYYVGWAFTVFGALALIGGPLMILYGMIRKGSPSQDKETRSGS